MTHTSRNPGSIARRNAVVKAREEKFQQMDADRETAKEALIQKKRADQDFPRWLEAVDKTFEQLAEDNPRSKRER